MPLFTNDSKLELPVATPWVDNDRDVLTKSNNYAAFADYIKTD